MLSSIGFSYDLIFNRKTFSNPGGQFQLALNSGIRADVLSEHLLPCTKCARLSLPQHSTKHITARHASCPPSDVSPNMPWYMTFHVPSLKPSGRAQPTWALRMGSLSSWGAAQRRSSPSICLYW